MPLLRERIYPKCPFASQFIISWISILDAVPDIDLILYLPELLDGLFKILGDPNKEVKKACDITLGEFLRSIKQDPSRVDFGGMINILISNAQDKNDDMVQVFELGRLLLAKHKFGLVTVHSYYLDKRVRPAVGAINVTIFVGNIHGDFAMSGLRFRFV